MQIIDSDGVWLVNRGQFRMPDPEAKHNFEPGEQVKIKYSSWAQLQPMIERCEDPTATPTAKQIASTAQANAEDAAAIAAREIEAEAAMAAANAVTAADAPTEPAVTAKAKP